MERFFRLSTHSDGGADYNSDNISHRSSQRFLYGILATSTSEDFPSYGVLYDNPDSR